MVDDRGPQLQAVCSTFLATAVISTLLRIYTRLGLVKSFGLDDWFMTGAMLAHIMFAACCLSGIHYGTGRQFTDLTEDGIMQALRVRGASMCLGHADKGCSIGGSAISVRQSREKGFVYEC